MVSQPKPATGKSPYFDIAEKHKVQIDFCSFIRVEGVTAKEFRQQKVTILDHTDEGNNGQQDDIAHGFLVHGCFGFLAGPLSSLAPQARTVQEGEVGAGLCLSSLEFPKVPAQLQAFFCFLFFFKN